MAPAPPKTTTGRGAGPGESYAGYARVSTAEQARPDHYSLSHQHQQIREYIARDSARRLYKLYTDPGVSGGTLDRPQLRQLIEDGRNGLFRKLVVCKLDRLGRDLLLLLQLERELTALGIEVVSLAESFGPDNDPVAVAMKQMCGVFSQLDRARLCQRMMEGRIRKLTEGKHAGGPAPLGYRISAKRELELDPASAELVKRIFRWRYGRRSYHWIARTLNEQGVVPPKGGRKFYAATIRFIVKNSAVYRGHAKYGRLTKGIHPPIL